jgi:hypothetical protein
MDTAKPLNHYMEEKQSSQQSAKVKASTGSVKELLGTAPVLGYQ